MLLRRRCDVPRSFYPFNIYSRHVASGYRGRLFAPQITLRTRGEMLVLKSADLNQDGKESGR